MKGQKKKWGERGARWRKVNGVGKQDPTRGQEGEEIRKRRAEE